METNTQIAPTLLWTGRIISGVVVLFMVFDGVTKMMSVPQVLEATVKLGIPTDIVTRIGMLLLVCTAVYAVPQTAVLGAILLTAYLGGATAIQVRAGAGAFPVVFAVACGMLAWVGLILREPRLLWTILLRQ